MKNKDGYVQLSPLVRSLPFLLLATLATISFGNTLGGFFLCDDLLHLDYMTRAFTVEPGLILAPFYSPWLKDSSFYAFYRPLSELSLYLDYGTYCSHAFGYHLTALLWHVLNVWLLFVLVKQLMLMPCFFIAGDKQRNVIGLCCAAIWACYPTHSEAIGWIAARSDLMATAFYFTTMLLFAKGLSGNRAINNALVALPLVLALLTKESAISLPFVLLFMALFNVRYEKNLSWLKGLPEALVTATPFFAILIIYLGVRGLALGDIVGGYSGSVGEALNKSVADRWFFGQSFFKIFHPFNDQIIAENSPLRLCLRIVWALCGLITLLSIRFWSIISAKNRLVLFTIIWLICTLIPNLQVWHFSTTMAGGRIAYLPTAPLLLLLVLAVYPLGVSTLDARQNLFIKLISISVFTALTVLGVIISNLNDLAGLEASLMVRGLRGQLSDLTDNLDENQKLVLVNLPTNIKGAFAFTNPGMVAPLLKPPLTLDDSSDKIIVLDAQPCSYPQINFGDWQAVSEEGKDKQYKFYYFDPDLQRLIKVTHSTTRKAFLSGQSTSPAASRKGILDVHNEEKGGENFRFKFSPPLNPDEHEYAVLSLTLSANASLSQNSPRRSICYVWNNAPTDEDGRKDSFSSTPILLPEPGRTTQYKIRIGNNKRWLLSHDVRFMQFFIPELKDDNCKLDLQLVSGKGISPTLKATVTGENETDKPISLKNMTANQTLVLTYDASDIAGAKAVKIELLPAFSYFEHYTRLLYKPAFIAQHLKIIAAQGTKGTITLKRSDFAKAAVYQLRACAVDAGGNLLEDFSEPVTLTLK